MAENTQHKLDTVRKPRVQITYDVEIGNAIQKKELPLVGGILADLSGNDAPAAPPLKKRKFVEIDRDTFDGVMKSITPRLKFSVDNTLTGDNADDTLPVELRFEKMDDFDPIAVLKQVPALRELFEARQRLSDLATKLDGNDDLERELREILGKPDEMETIKGLLAPAPADSAADAAAGA
jgi:type VI secretion system protein ImpB